MDYQGTQGVPAPMIQDPAVVQQIVNEALKQVQATHLSHLDMGTLERFDALLKDPRMAGYVKFASDPELLKNVADLAGSEKWRLLGMIEVVAFVAFLLVRAILASRIDRQEWMARLWLQLWTSVVFWAIAVIVIPTIILGNPYAAVLKGVYRFVSGQV